MMTRKDGLTEIIEPAPTVVATDILPLGLRQIPALLDDHGRGVAHAAHPLRPRQGTDGLQTFGVVDEILDVQHGAHRLATSPGSIYYATNRLAQDPVVSAAPCLGSVGNCPECIKSIVF